MNTINRVFLGFIASILVCSAHADTIIGNLPTNNLAGYKFWLSDANKAAVGITMSASFTQITFNAMLAGNGATVTAGIYDNSNTPGSGSFYPGAYPGNLLLSLGSLTLSGNGYSGYMFTADPSFVMSSGFTYYVMLSGPAQWGVESANDNNGATPISPGNVATNALSGTRWISGGNYGDSRTPSFELGGVVAVPEPSTYAMIGAGALGLLAMRRRRA